MKLIKSIFIVSAFVAGFYILWHFVSIFVFWIAPIVGPGNLLSGMLITLVFAVCVFYVYVELWIKEK